MFGMVPKRRPDGQLADALSDVVRAIDAHTKQRKTEFDWFKSHFDLATKKDLKDTENKIMSAISDFAAKQKAFNDRQDKAVEGLTEDVKTLNDKITELQNNPGTITPEDQALLDDIQARSEGIATKLEALDALTPPTVPPTP